MFGGKGPAVDVPSSTEDALLALRKAIEFAIKRGLLRIDLELPVGLRLGGTEGGLDSLNLPSEEPSKERIVRADRDAARCLALLYKPVEETLCLAFRTSGFANKARKVWKEAKTGGHIFALDGGGRAGKQRKAFGASGGDAADIRKLLQERRCSHLVVVAPRARQLRILDELDDEVPELAIIMVNARLRGPGSSSLAEDARTAELRERLALRYDPVFHISLLDGGSGFGPGILYRTLGEDKSTPWILARKELELTEGGDGERLVARELLRSSMEPSYSSLVKALDSGR